MSELEPQSRPFLRRLAVLAFVCLLAQCTLTGPGHQAPPPPQALESAQASTPTPEEQLELLNTFLDRA